MASLVKKKVPNKPWGFLGARKGKNKMRQFGKVKYMQKPKSPEDWHKIYLQHQIELPHVKSISLNWSSYGPKQAGIRYFKVFISVIILLSKKLIKDFNVLVLSNSPN